MSHAALLLIALLLQPQKPVDPVPPLRDRPQDDEVKVKIQFKDAPIEDVITYISKVTGYVIKDEAKVSGKVTAWSDTDIPKSHVLAFLDSVLAPNHATVKMGTEVKILRFEEAKRRTLDVRVSALPAEVPNTDQVLTVIYPLKNLNVVEVNKELDDLYPKNATVLINTYSNTLIMTGRADEIHKVMMVLSMLDVEAKEKLHIEVVALVNADATETAKLVNELLIKEAEEERTNPFARMFGMMQNQGGGVKAKEVASEIIRVAADTRTNSIIVASTKANIDLIVTTIKQLDTVSSSVKVALYALKYADAETVAQLIADMFEQRRGQNQQGGNQQRQQGMWWARGGGQAQGAQAQEAASSGEVKAVADLRTNTVVVTAARKIHEGIIQPLVDELDKKTSDFQTFRYFRLKHADALDVASQVRSMFDTSATSATTSTTANRTAGRTGGGSTAQGGTTGSTQPRAVGQSPNQKVYIGTDERMNSLMVRASAQQMEQIEAMIKELDSPQAPDEAFIVVRARHTDPVRMQQILTNLTGTATAQGQQQQQGAWTNPFSTYRTAGQQGGQMNSSQQQQNPFNNFGRSSSGGAGGRSGGGFRP